MSAPSSALRVSERDFGDGLTDSIAAIRIHRELDGPQPFGNPLLRLMKDPPQPMILVRHEDGTTTCEPDKPTAWTLLRKAKYANARAKARVATAHMRTRHPGRLRVKDYRSTAARY